MKAKRSRKRVASVREYVASKPKESRASLEAVRRAILSLPTHYREVVVLCELNEMDYAEAANVLGCAVGTVRSRLNRARGMLARKLRVADTARCMG